jgi:hypothetical protein
MNNDYITQAELRHKGWSTQRIFHLGRPDVALLDDTAHPPAHYISLRAEHGARAQRAWQRERVQADEIKRAVLNGGMAGA